MDCFNTENKNAPSHGCGVAEPLASVATRCLRLKLFYAAAFAAGANRVFPQAAPLLRAFFLLAEHNY